MSRLRSDRVLSFVLNAAALLCGALVLGIVLFLSIEAAPTIFSGKISAFFTDEKWQPGSERDPQFGIFSMLLASVLITLLAAILAVPVGICGAIFRVFYAPESLAKWQDRFLELLAGIPSVIFGFWGLSVIVPFINRYHPPGQSLLAAGIVLALMILPTIALTTKSALTAISPSLMAGAAALGLSRPAQILQVAIPTARKGIAAGCALGLGRAIGETMAVVMVCGNIAQIPHSVFDPVRPVTSTIALEMGYATAEHKSYLYAAGLVLVLMTALFLLVRIRKGASQW
ncbi:MAG: phosphate ABC transporter permease subunit PstC [Verrucomicrobiales bacterium]|nr:phosphate ABC transporter permease subunit PstC [Verrucomicrobiales bacterium]